MPNNRGACCHVAGDIDFDSQNNLWMVTGDDTPAGGGNSGGFGPFNDQLTNEIQTIKITGATGGTFTLTFDGQTTAPIPFPLDNAAIESALEALVQPRRRRRDRERGDEPHGQLPRQPGGAGRAADDGGRLRPDGHGADATVAMATINNGQGIKIPAEGGHVQRAARRRPAVRAEHERPPRQDAADHGQGRRHRAGRRERVRRRVHRPGRQPLSRSGRPGRAPEVYAMGFRNPFRITLDKNDVAYVSDYSPDSQTPRSSAARRAPAASRSSASRRTTAGRSATGPTSPYYQWDFNTSTPLPSAAAPELHECDNPARGPQNTSRWVASGGPTVEPGLEFGPPITNPEIWYSYRDN